MANALDRRDTQAGLIAASDFVVSKQIFNRQAPLPSSEVRLRAPSVVDAPRLFSGQEAGEDEIGWQHRIGRLSAAALVYSANKMDLRQADRLLRGSDSSLFEERSVLKKLHHVREKHFRTDRSCPHCRLLYSSLYCDPWWKNFPPIQVVHHNRDAKAIVSFDPDTCISEGKVERFQMIVPQPVAKTMIQLAHPLNWAKAPGGFFRSITAVHADGSDLTGTPEQIREDWETQLSNQNAAHILEDVEWPINQNLRSNAENILKIANRGGDGDRSIEYDYSLQRCVRTNFGVAWEPSGLDIDGGQYAGSRISLDPEQITAVAVEKDQLPLAHLTRRDVLELKTKFQLEAWQDLFCTEDDKTLYNGWDSPSQDKATPVEIAREVAELVKRLEVAWKPLKFDLLTMKLSKRLHFTVPEYSPIELWYLLTWMAPSILFLFLNAVCQAPHILLKQMPIQPLSKVSYGH
jgi:hypothetical protein